MIHQLKRATWMRLSLLDRWLVKELIVPLLFFIALFTLLLLTGGVMFELVRQMVDKNLPAGIALQVLLLSIPRWMAFSVPIGTLMASLFVFTRLSANNELTALRSLGVSTVRMISAALVLSMLMTLFTFVLNDVVVPSHNAMQRCLSSVHWDVPLFRSGSRHHLPPLWGAHGCNRP